MSRFSARLTIILIALFQFSALVSAGTLDDYYLQQFGEAKSLQLEKAVLSVTSTQVTAQCGMPLKHGLRRDWNLLEPSTQKVLAKQLALPALSGLEQTVLSSGGHFKVHYTTSGADAPHINDYTVNNTLIRGINYYTGLTSAADWAATVAATFEYVYTQYGSLGYQLAPTTSGTYDIYLNDQASKGYYGVTHSGSSSSSAVYPFAVTSWMELDSSFTDSIFKPTTFTPLQSLQVTATHEYHHAIQYGYNIFFDIWYAEATSTWMEDELYDNVNQLYNYIPSWFTQSTLSLDTPENLSTGGGYGRWIFNRYLSEQHGPAMIRNVWEKVGSLPSPGGNADIPMAPVLDSVLSTTYGTSLGNDFFGFSKRVYQRDAWTDHAYDSGRIHPYAPLATYSAYPVNSTNSSPTPSIILPGYSFAYYRLTPTFGVTSLSIFINKTSGVQTALYVNSTEIPVTAGGNATYASYIANGLSTSDAVVLLIANTSSVDGHNANFSTDGSLVAVTEPSTPPSSSTSGNSGCFIATAAYGSYLHPHVQQLRNFRDEYLLTNAPGRTFVALYYRCSPPLADFIARHPLLRGITRLALTPLVAVVIHPLLSAAALLLGGAGLMVRFRRIAASHAYADIHRTSSTSSRV